MVQGHQVDVIANNVANVGTTGFKRDIAVFQQRAAESQSSPALARYGNAILDGLGGGTWVNSSQTEFEQGDLDKTSSGLDVAVQGPGFLAVRTAAGQTAYTRDGHLTAETGTLALVNNGATVLDGSGQPISVDPSQPVSISSDGTVAQGSGVVGQIATSGFANPRALQKIGNNLYTAPAGTATTGPTSLAVGMLEKSNVEPVTQLTAMIEAQRAYEANAQMIKLQDETLNLVVNNLGRVTA
jgi:flagellar basal body rod protein FlgG